MTPPSTWLRIQRPEPGQVHQAVSFKRQRTGSRTQNLLGGETHDVHGVHGLLEVVLVLLSWDGDVTVGQEAVVAESF